MLKKDDQERLNISPLGADNFVDTRYLKCPHPVLRANRLLTQMSSGALLEIWANDAMAVSEIPLFCEQTGHELLQVSLEEGKDYHRFLIRCC